MRRVDKEQIYSLFSLRVYCYIAVGFYSLQVYQRDTLSSIQMRKSPVLVVMITRKMWTKNVYSNHMPEGRWHLNFFVEVVRFAARVSL